jgi:UDP-N-acetylglucosamine pyrophosphorylase
LMVIPMKNQFEQQCNAAALKAMGVPVIKSLKKKHIETIEKWTVSGKNIAVNYPDETEKILQDVLKIYWKD